MGGEASPVQVAGFLMALRAKGETVEEMRGLADVMLAHANRIEVAGPSLDIVGTGGDRAHTVNISTMAAIVVAATGVAGGQARQPFGVLLLRVGRRPRGARGQPDAEPRSGGRGRAWRRASRSASRRPSTRRCGTRPSARRDLGIGTAFNFLGPLTNPAQPTYAAVGVRRPADGAADRRGLRRPRQGRRRLPRRRRPGRAHRLDDLDGLVGAVGAGHGATGSTPTQLGLTLHPLETLRGADAAHNAGVVRDGPGRGDRAGPRRGGAQRRDRAGTDRAGRGTRAPRRSPPRCGRAWTGQSRRSTTGRPPRSSTAGSPRPQLTARLAGCRQARGGGPGGCEPDAVPGGANRSGVVEAEAEGRLEVVLWSRCGRRCASACRVHPGDLVEPVGDDVGEVLVRRTRTMAIRSTSPVTE